MLGWLRAEAARASLLNRSSAWRSRARSSGRNLSATNRQGRDNEKQSHQSSIGPRPPDPRPRLARISLRTGCAAHLLVEPLGAPPPGLIRRSLVVTLRRRVIVETMNSAGINMTLVWHVRFL